MTKKDFILIAEALRVSKPNADHLAEWRATVEEFVWRLARDNPRFNASVFREAAGLFSHPDPRGPMPLEMREQTVNGETGLAFIQNPTMERLVSILDPARAQKK